MASSEGSNDVTRLKFSLSVEVKVNGIVFDKCSGVFVLYRWSHTKCLRVIEGGNFCHLGVLLRDRAVRPLLCNPFSDLILLGWSFDVRDLGIRS